MLPSVIGPGGCFGTICVLPGSHHLGPPSLIRAAPGRICPRLGGRVFAKAGLPPSREIFAIDYKGSPAPSDADEAEVVEAEISPPDTVAK
jgi:hypothetical protein